MDLGTDNNKIWKEMNGNRKEKNKNLFFTHPSDNDLKVFIFADGSHLLKLIRNHYLDRRFLIRDKHVNKTFMERMLSNNKPQRFKSYV